MAKGQRKSNKEIRKPKKEGPPKMTALTNAQKNDPLANLIKRD